ncbi:MAG TPA: hypothetical protein VGM23_01195 [Armatimonadota bacterium]
MSLCKDEKKAKKDAEKVEELIAEGRSYYTCKKCGRVSHKEDHLCKPEKTKK